jgi:hypothetical protein
MTRRKRTEPDATPKWVYDTFPLSDLAMGKLRGNVLQPEEAYLWIAFESDEENPGGELKVIGATALKRLYVHLQEFLSKLESPEVH